MAALKMGNKRFYGLLLLSLLGLFVWSFHDARDRFTWYLEAAPVIIALALLLLTYRRLRFTHLVYVLIWVHAIILLVGAHYTYAEMPLFNWLRDEGIKTQPLRSHRSPGPGLRARHRDQRNLAAPNPFCCQGKCSSSW